MNHPQTAANEPRGQWVSGGVARTTPRALYLVLAAAVLALTAAALQAYRSVENELTDAALARRASIAYLAAPRA